MALNELRAGKPTPAPRDNRSENPMVEIRTELARLQPLLLESYDEEYAGLLERQRVMEFANRELVGEETRTIERIHVKQASPGGDDDAEGRQLLARYKVLKQKLYDASKAGQKLAAEMVPSKERAVVKRKAAWTRLQSQALLETIDAFIRTKATNDLLTAVETAAPADAITAPFNWGELQSTPSGSRKLETWLALIRRERPELLGPDDDVA